MFQQSALNLWILALCEKGQDQAEQIYTLCEHMFCCLYCTVCTATWPQYCQPITEELQVNCFARIGPIDGF